MQTSSAVDHRSPYGQKGSLRGKERNVQLAHKIKVLARNLEMVARI